MGFGFEALMTTSGPRSRLDVRGKGRAASAAKTRRRKTRAGPVRPAREPPCVAVCAARTTHEAPLRLLALCAQREGHHVSQSVLPTRHMRQPFGCHRREGGAWAGEGGAWPGAPWRAVSSAFLGAHQFGAACRGHRGGIRGRAARGQERGCLVLNTCFLEPVVAEGDGYARGPPEVHPRARGCTFWGFRDRPRVSATRTEFPQHQPLKRCFSAASTAFSTFSGARGGLPQHHPGRCMLWNSELSPPLPTTKKIHFLF